MPIVPTNPHPFVYQKPNAAGVRAIETVRQACASTYEDLINCVPPSRERSLAITKLEEVSMWANKGIVFNPTQEEV